MTLILTEVSTFGIAMAAESAVTRKKRGQPYVVPNAAKKLQTIPHLKAGISCWGLGTIGGTSTDQWLSEFIESSTAYNSLQKFAEELADQLNEQVPGNNEGKNRLGFHLAGFENFEGVQTPSFYHIVDGPSTTLSNLYGITVNPNQFNANHEVPPEKTREIIRSGKGWVISNGDSTLYVKIFEDLRNLFDDFFQREGIKIPDSRDLSRRADYLVFQIRTMSEIYKMSNMLPGIGGEIRYLTIDQRGITSEGIKVFSEKDIF